MSDSERKMDRREFVNGALHTSAVVGLTGFAAFLAGSKGHAESSLWQIDPAKCIACDRCATNCVLDVSAVKCVHSFEMCGYCQLCTGYFEPDPNELNSAAENQLCPTGAIRRTFVEDPYYEYEIDAPLCIACGKCVKGCNAFGNGSLHLQVMHDRCVRCNQCSIAVSCPSQAFVRVPATNPYKFKHK